jgi:diguanylate cyclase (GGDEF)-like protein
MQIDAFTVILLGVLIKALLGSLFLIFWLYDRRAVWFGWWSATYFIGTLAALVFALRGFAGELGAIGAGVAALIGAFGCCWQGTRAFERRRPLWGLLLLAPGLWFGFCLVPGFLDDLRARVIVSSLLIAILIAMAAVEFWRGRQERLVSRWPAIALFGSLSLIFASRIAFVDLLPFPFGALPLQPAYVAAFNVLVFLHTLVLTVLLVAMTKERLELDQRTKAQTDPLTGALNRRALSARGGRLLKRHEHEAAPLCLLFLDIDHFKSLNDRLGHFGGDDVLMLFVAVVNDNIRPTDFLFRIGGEEFCCMLPHTDTERAHRVAERIRHRFEMATVEVARTPVRSTVSIGIASTEQFGYDLDALMRRADAAVYAAKRAGRNRVAGAADEAAKTGAGVAAAVGGGIAAAM